MRRRMRYISPLLAGRRPQPLPVRDGRADERVGVVRAVGAVETERGLAADGGQSRSDGYTGPGGGGRNGTTRLTGRPQIVRATGGPRTFVRATAHPPADARSEAGTHALGRHRPAIRSRNGTLKVYHRR